MILTLTALAVGNVVLPVASESALAVLSPHNQLQYRTNQVDALPLAHNLLVLWLSVTVTAKEIHHVPEI